MHLATPRPASAMPIRHAIARRVISLIFPYCHTILTITATSHCQSSTFLVGLSQTCEKTTLPRVASVRPSDASDACESRQVARGSQSMVRPSFRIFIRHVSPVMPIDFAALPSRARRSLTQSSALLSAERERFLILSLTSFKAPYSDVADRWRSI